MDYYENNLALTMSIIPKSHTVAVSMNINLRKQYPDATNLYDSEDMNTWIYYVNLKGDRFKTMDNVYLQSEIELESIDEGGTIVLDKTTIANYPRTRARLRELGVHYDSLVSRYPDQGLRIRSIIFGIIVDPVKVKDGTILILNDSLIEENEYTLIDDLQIRIGNHMSRWDVREFVLGEEFYVPGLLVALAQRVLLDLLNLRMERTFTVEVNSFFLNSYFNSRLFLGRSTEVLTYKVRLWLYRNLSTIIYNLGTNKTLDSIIKNVLEPSGIIVYKYDIVTIEPSHAGIYDSIFNKDRIINTSDGTNVSLEYMLFLEARHNTRVPFVYKDTGYKENMFRRIASTNGITENTKVLRITERQTSVVNNKYKDIVNIESAFLRLDTISITYTISDILTGSIYYKTSKELIYTLLFIIRKIIGTEVPFTDKLKLTNLLSPSVVPIDARVMREGHDTISNQLLKITNKLKTSIYYTEDYINNTIMTHLYIKYYLSNIGINKSIDTMTRFSLASSGTKEIPLNITGGFDAFMIANKHTVYDPDNRSKEDWVKLLDDIIHTVTNVRLTIIKDTRLELFQDMLNKLTSYTIQVIKADNSVAKVYSVGSGLLGVNNGIKALSIQNLCGECASIRPTVTAKVITS